MSPEFISLGDAVLAEIAPFRKSLDTGPLFRALREWWLVAREYDGLPESLAQMVRWAGVVLVLREEFRTAEGTYPPHVFIEDLTAWAGGWEPAWERAKTGSPEAEPVPGQWQYLHKNIWLKDGSPKRVSHGGEPSEILAKFIASGPGGIVEVDPEGTGPKLLRERVLTNCAELGIEMKLTASIKAGLIVRMG